MKTQEFLKIIRKTVREEVEAVFKSEIKEIILESLKSQNSTQQPLMESKTPSTEGNVTLNSKQGMKDAYRDILAETAGAMNTSQFSGKFNPTPGGNSQEGTLPAGEVDLESIKQIMGNR